MREGCTHGKRFDVHACHLRVKPCLFELRAVELTIGYADDHECCECGKECNRVRVRTLLVSYFYYIHAPYLHEVRASHGEQQQYLAIISVSSVHFFKALELIQRSSELLPVQ